MSLIKLYRPEGNSGVRVLMTSDAHEAAMAKLAYYAEHGSYDDLDKGIAARIAAGTFTFVSAFDYMLAGATERHYGTHSMLDYFVARCDVVLVADRIYVPFSNGPRGYDQDFRDGYGCCPGRLRLLAADTHEAYRMHDSIIELIESNG